MGETLQPRLTSVQRSVTFDGNRHSGHVGLDEQRRFLKLCAPGIGIMRRLTKDPFPRRANIEKMSASSRLGLCCSTVAAHMTHVLQSISDLGLIYQRPSFCVLSTGIIRDRLLPQIQRGGPGHFKHDRASREDCPACLPLAHTRRAVQLRGVEHTVGAQHLA